MQLKNSFDLTELFFVDFEVSRLWVARWSRLDFRFALHPVVSDWWFPWTPLGVFTILKVAFVFFGSRSVVNHVEVGLLPTVRNESNTSSNGLTSCVLFRDSKSSEVTSVWHYNIVENYFKVKHFMGKQHSVSEADARDSFLCDLGEMPHHKACAIYPHLPKMGTFYFGHKCT